MLHVLGGRAFLDHLHDVHAYPSSSLPFFTLHVYFRGQRFVSSPVQCACEPDIRETFLLELTKQTREKLDLSDVLSVSDNIHLVLTRTVGNGGREMVGSCHVEWRQVLSCLYSNCYYCLSYYRIICTLLSLQQLLVLSILLPYNLCCRFLLNREDGSTVPLRCVEQRHQSLVFQLGCWIFA